MHEEVCNWSAVVFFVLSACMGGKTATAPQASGKEHTFTKETPQGKEQITVTEGEGGEDWCKKGMSWSYAGPQGAASFVIKGKTTYKGKEVCEGEYVDKTTGQKVVIYFTKGQEHIWWVIYDANGNKITEYELTGGG